MSAVNHLLAQLRNRSDPAARRRAAHSLARVQPPEPEIVSGLISLLTDPDTSVSQAGVKALVKLGLAGVVGIMCVWPDASVPSKKAMIGVLKRLGPLSAPALPLLRAAVVDVHLRPLANDAINAIRRQELAKSGTTGRGGWGRRLGAAAVLLWILYQGVRWSGLVEATGNLQVIGAMCLLLGGTFGYLVFRKFPRVVRLGFAVICGVAATTLGLYLGNRPEFGLAPITDVLNKPGGP